MYIYTYVYIHLHFLLYFLLYIYPRGDIYQNIKVYLWLGIRGDIFFICIFHFFNSEHVFCQTFFFMQTRGKKNTCHADPLNQSTSSLFSCSAQTDSCLPTSQRGESEHGLGREWVGSPSGLWRFTQDRTVQAGWRDGAAPSRLAYELVCSKCSSPRVTLSRRISNIWLWTWQDVVQSLGKSRVFLLYS